MKRNYIVIEGGTRNEVEIILGNFCQLYREGGKVKDIQFCGKNNASNSFLVFFETELDFEHYAYLINYLTYPEGIKNWSSKIYGYYFTNLLTENYEFNVGEYLMLYVSNNDSDYDNVNVVNFKNETYLYDFEGKISKLGFTERNYNFPSIVESEYQIIKAIIIESDHNEMNESKPWWKFW